MQSQELPIDSYLPQILDCLEKSQRLILVAPPGTGKTTRVPLALMQSKLFTGQEVLVLEPRRLAAKLSADRVAETLGEHTGQTVGYIFRSEAKRGSNTRLTYMTEGTFTRRLLRDPTLKGVGVVVLDEFHERHLQGDLALAFLKRLQTNHRKDLRLVVMSATLETEKLKSYLGTSSEIDVESKMFPVQVEYLKETDRPLDKKLEWAIPHTIQKTKGHILVFLPGIYEIRRAQTILAPLASNHAFSIHALHGSFSKEEQAKVFQESQVRKVILTTNIAETSLTIPGVEAVIDSGLHRQAYVSSWSGTGELKTRRISQASAIQRKGRAGRQAPGFCLRLYSKAEFDSLLPQDSAEIHRVDLGTFLLELKSLKINNPQNLDLMDRPSEGRLMDAARTLYTLGATDSVQLDSNLTSLGESMAELPLSPRSARVVIEAQKKGITHATLQLIAELEGDDPKRLLKYLDSDKKDSEDDPEVLSQVVLTGFADRVARAQKQGTKLVLTMAGGGRSEMTYQSWMQDHDFFLVLSPQHIRPIDVKWLWDLQPLPLEEKDSWVWNKTKAKVEYLEQITLGQILIEERLVKKEATVEATKTLLAAYPNWRVALEGAVEKEDLENTLYRLSQVTKESLDEMIVKLLGCVSLRDELASRFTDERLSEILEPQVYQKLKKQFPTHISLPSGRKTKIYYSLDRDPWVESRLQDFFGMKETPKVGDNISLTLHLLAPNQRPVQVTRDLMSFWTNTYPQLKKELQRRYPKHNWPEDPLRIN